MKKLQIILILLCSLVIQTGIIGQTPSCLAAFSLGPDRVLCDPDNSVLIQPVSNWEVLSLSWQLSNGAVLLDSATVQVVTDGVEEMIATASIRSANLIQNGDFSAGNSGFSSDLFHSPFTLLPPGTYAIMTNPGNFHPDFSDCTDHTSGSGRMFASNGSASPNRDAWCQDVAIEPGGEYEISFWAAALTENQLPQLVIRLDGQDISTPLVVGPQLCEWVQSGITWTTGLQTSVEVCIRNLTGSNSGNDFALDDIDMRQICTTSDTLKVYYQPKQVTIMDTLVCAGTSLVIGNNTYTTSIIDTIVTQDFRGCDSMVIVHVEMVDPGLSSSTPEVLNCLIHEVDLQGFSTYSGPGQTFTWFDPSGTMMNSSGNGSQIFVDEAGVYTLEWTLSTIQGSCNASISIDVIQDTLQPFAQAGPDDTLTCAQPELVLTGTGSSVGSGFVYLWTNLDGTAPFPDNQLNSTAIEPGRYVINVTNTGNFCSAEDTLVLSENIMALTGIDIQVGNPFCRNTSGWAEVISITEGAPPFIYELSGINGTFVQDTPRFSGLTPGDYSLLVIDAGGCSSEILFTVPALVEPDFNLPVGLSSEGGSVVTITPILGFADSLVHEYLWNSATFTLSCPTCKETEVSGLMEGHIELCLVTLGGCIICRETTISFDVPNLLYIPTAFSPNGDGINDTFKPFPGGSVIRHFLRFSIFDRWGNELYAHRADVQSTVIPEWDGTSGGKEMDPGIFIFLIEAELVDGRLFQWSGEIFLGK